LILPGIASAAVIAGALMPLSALRDPVTGGVPTGAQLVLPPGYVLFSPFSRLFDTIGLFAPGQHIAVALTTILLALVVAYWRTANSSRRSLRIATAVAISFCALLIAYACAGALPRPMAALAVSDTSVARVDFHSHTKFSHDARSGFTPDANRAWHRAGGFDVAYISDHNSFTGAQVARRGNPARAGDGTVLLSAFEGRYLLTFEIFLSLTEADSVVLMDWRRWLRNGPLLSGRMPSSVVALPSPLKDVQASGRDDPPHISAIEIVDGSPRGFAQQDREGRAIIERADSLGLALVVGSNNHGWGYVVPGWALVSIPGWRAFSPDSLAAAIEHTIHASPRTAVRVIERRRPSGTGAGLALTVPVAIEQVIRALTFPERIMWIVWIWVIAIIAFRPWARNTLRSDAVNG
jgi:hypothetical protein